MHIGSLHTPSLVLCPHIATSTDQHKRLYVLRNKHFGEMLCLLCVIGVVRAKAYVSADKETAIHRFDQ